MKFDFITIFPDQIKAFLSEGVFRIAEKKKLVEYSVWNLRDWTTDRHKTVDDRPYGGGPGMLLKIEPLYKAINQLRTPSSTVILTSPSGQRLHQQTLRELSKDSDAHYIIICGHYEGVDERVKEHLIDMEISIGDYVLSGGELASLCIADGIVRLIPGVLGNDSSTTFESFENGVLDYPQWTRPEEFNGWNVPKVFTEGNHAEIAKWRKQMSLASTKQKRPDLL